MTEVERRLQLTRFLREENFMNRQKIRNREEILYGVPKGQKGRSELQPVLDEYGDGEAGLVQTGAPASTGFGLRLVVAVLLFAGVVYMRQNRTELFGYSMTELLARQISVSAEEKLIDFVSNFTDFQ